MIFKRKSNFSIVFWIFCLDLPQIFNLQLSLFVLGSLMRFNARNEHMVHRNYLALFSLEIVQTLGCLCKVLKTEGLDRINGKIVRSKRGVTKNR